MNPIALYSLPEEHKFLFVLLLIWTIVWKGLALWKAGRKNDMVWFIILLVVSTAGILDIVYIYHISKRKRKEKSAE